LPDGSFQNTGPVSVAQNIELFTHALSVSRPTIIFIPDKVPIFQTARLNMDTWQP